MRSSADEATRIPLVARRHNGMRKRETNAMDPVEPLIIDLLEWIGPHARPYAEVMDAWRTSCPRLPVWEEANARGYVDRVHSASAGERVTLSQLGREALERHRRFGLANDSPRGSEAATPLRGASR